MSSSESPGQEAGMIPAGEKLPVHNSAVLAVGGSTEKLLNRAEFDQLREVPPEVEWFGEIDNPNTRRAYQADVKEFMDFLGIETPAELRSVVPAHITAWRKQLLQRQHQPKTPGGTATKKQLSHSTIRRKLSAVSSLFDFLVGKQAVEINPTKGLRRPRKPSERTPAPSDVQARQLMAAPPADTLKGKRDRALLATLLHHGFRREELCRLKVGDMIEDKGVLHFRIHGKGDSVRYVPIHPLTRRLIHDYLETAGHSEDLDGPLYRAVKKKTRAGTNREHLKPDSIFRNIVHYYCKQVGLPRFSPHSLRHAAATNALDHGADIERVRRWLGHKNLATTQIYDQREDRAEESPTFKVEY